MRKRTFGRASLFILASLLPLAASAHEAYVLPRDFFWNGINSPFDPMALQALRDPANLRITLSVVGGTLIALALNFLFRLTSVGRKMHAFPERFAALGPVFVRAAIAAALFIGALNRQFLGPELPFSGLPQAEALRWLLLASSVFIAAGFLTELAALAAIGVYAYSWVRFGPYLITYLNYLGELVVLASFGLRRWSVDAVLFGPLKRWMRWEKYGTSIVRICYGAALLYAGITVKFLHPALTVRVVEDWHLTSFHWLFPSDPLLVTLGGGLAEAAIGLFIIFGFEMRLTVLISLFYITLSLLYFRELVWPHLMLYGISLNLLVQPEVFTLDHLLFQEHRLALPWWKRPFQPHGTPPAP